MSLQRSDSGLPANALDRSGSSAGAVLGSSADSKAPALASRSSDAHAPTPLRREPSDAPDLSRAGSGFSAGPSDVAAKPEPDNRAFPLPGRAAPPQPHINNTRLAVNVPPHTDQMRVGGLLSDNARTLLPSLSSLASVSSDAHASRAPAPEQRSTPLSAAAPSSSSSSSPWPRVKAEPTAPAAASSFNARRPAPREVIDVDALPTPTPTRRPAASQSSSAPAAPGPQQASPLSNAAPAVLLAPKTEQSDPFCKRRRLSDESDGMPPLEPSSDAAAPWADAGVAARSADVPPSDPSALPSNVPRLQPSPPYWPGLLDPSADARRRQEQLDEEYARMLQEQFALEDAQRAPSLPKEDPLDREIAHALHFEEQRQAELARADELRRQVEADEEFARQLQAEMLAAELEAEERFLAEQQGLAAAHAAPQFLGEQRAEADARAESSSSQPMAVPAFDDGGGDVEPMDVDVAPPATAEEQQQDASGLFSPLSVLAGRIAAFFTPVFAPPAPMANTVGQSSQQPAADDDGSHGGARGRQLSHPPIAMPPGPVCEVPIVKPAAPGASSSSGGFDAPMPSSGNAPGKVSQQDIQRLFENQDEALEEQAQPPSLTVQLFDWQRRGLRWMTRRETDKECRGWILADEMGLGKTVETLACMLANRKPGPQQTLIVCPVSLVQHWERSIKRQVAPDALPKVHIYHGKGKARTVKELESFDVVITTFSTMASELELDKEDKKMVFIGNLLQAKWYRVILDEAHAIKNKATLTHRASLYLEAKIRWCLSGTPIQNHLDDMFSLLRFLRCSPYDEYAVWKTEVVKSISRDPERGFRRLRAVLRPIVLRRQKDQTFNGKPLIELPPKEMVHQHVIFSAEEQDFYDALFKRSQIQFNKYVRQGTWVQNYTNILVMLLRLRQACNHPSLVIGGTKFAADAPEDAAPDVAPSGADALPADLQRRILSSESRECSICLDLFTSNNPMSTPCGHVFCRDCIVATLEARPDATCPLCRKPVTVQQLLPLGVAVPLKADPAERGKSSAQHDSTKIRMLMQMLREMRAKDPKTKAVIFSQWTSMLDLLEPLLKAEGVDWLRFDGSMTMAQRSQTIAEFEDGPVTLMLMSLKAGGVGINLCCATHVFMLDLWWNPAVELQAMERVYRVGQTKPVTMAKITIKDTIEERILSLQAKKTAMAEGALGTGALGNMQRLTLDDLKFLFQ